jgi:FkbM family methyltransferase
MAVVSLLRNVGNKAYYRSFPIYHVLYRAFKAYTDRAERQLLRTILSAGAVTVDAGANIGIYSQFLSRCVGATGVVHSFEPSPENFRRLQSATRKLNNVRVSHAAIGEHTGKSMLYISHRLNVDHRTYLTKEDPRDALPIDIVALDDYFKPGQRVDLIKMDIQGYELHALRGATRVLQENPNINLLLEFWPLGLQQAGVHWEELIAMLRSFSMDVTVVRPSGLASFDACHVQLNTSWYINLFARRSQRQARR